MVPENMQKALNKPLLKPMKPTDKDRPKCLLWPSKPMGTREKNLIHH